MSARTNERTNERANACSNKIFPFLCKLYLANMCLESAQVSQILGGKIALGFCKCLPGSPFSLSLSLSSFYSQGGGQTINRTQRGGEFVSFVRISFPRSESESLSLFLPLSHFSSPPLFCKSEKDFADIQSVVERRDKVTTQKKINLS